MKTREKKARIAQKKRRRRAITRRRQKKVLPVQHIRKKRLPNYGILRANFARVEPLCAPSDFRLISNTEECVAFFRKIRERKSESIKNNNRRELQIDMRRVNQIDFASTMVLNAVCEELASSSPVCHVWGTSPVSIECRQYLLDSGFLNGKYDERGRRFPLSGNSANMKIEKGRTKLKDDDVRIIVDIEKRIHQHVSGLPGTRFKRVEMIKEILGNTVDWSEAFQNEWYFGAKFEQDKVIVVALDLGKGILESISRNFTLYVQDLLKSNSHLQILEQAFDRKYGSKSGRANRNQGLPSIKLSNEAGNVRDLVVVTNNVLLDFANTARSCKFVSRKDRGFNGTLYCWCVDSTCC